MFKIFVANPKKSKPVAEILVRNKKKLIEFLTKFQKDKGESRAVSRSLRLAAFRLFVEVIWRVRPTHG